MRDKIYFYLLGLLPGGKANAMTIGVFMGEAMHTAVIAVTPTLDELESAGWILKEGEDYMAVPGARDRSLIFDYLAEQSGSPFTLDELTAELGVENLAARLDELVEEGSVTLLPDEDCDHGYVVGAAPEA